MARVQQKVRDSDAAPPRDRRPFWIGGLLLLLLLALGAMAAVGLSRRGPDTSALTDEGIALDGRFIGNPDAPLLIREFADFQCSHCRDAASELVPEVIESYVKRGDVRLEVIPVAVVGAGSVTAAEAALCAEEQGQFWLYHDELFAKQGQVQLDVAGLTGLAVRLGLNEQSFRSCVGSGKHRAQVGRNTEEMGQLGGEGTPFFLVGNVPVAGAVPFVQMQQAIDGQLGE